MSEAELAAKIDYVCANIQQLENKDNDEIRYLCEMLIDYRNINTSRLAELAWEHGLTYYQTIYKDAPPQVVEEMLMVRETFGTTILLVTHNLGVIRAMADNVLVLRGGEAVEYGNAKEILADPQSEYTRKLLAAVPKLRR